MPKILIIEDDKELNCFLQDYLANNKYQTVSTYTGEEGLQAWQREKPDLILLDLNLPGMNGLDLTREIRRVDNTPNALSKNGSNPIVNAPDNIPDTTAAVK